MSDLTVSQINLSGDLTAEEQSISGSITVVAKGDKGNKGDKGDTYVLPPATNTVLGGVIIGDNVIVDADGKISTAMSAADKTKLDGIEAGAQVNILGQADKTKLDGISAGAQVNVIEHVSVNGNELSVSDKSVGFYEHLMRKNSTAYAAGDIAYMTTLPSWARLECVTAGTTAATAPDVSSVSSGGLLSDGGVLWIVDDVRDGNLIGSVVGSIYLPPGYVKCNGATVNRADYPRLVALATKYKLWTSNTASNLGLFGTGDGSTTFVLPNWVGRMAQYAATSGGTVAAGLPNITGYLGRTYTDVNTSNAAFTFANPVSNQGFYGTSSSNNRTSDINLDASGANAIYGASTTVQPPAINVIPCMKY